MPERLTYNEVCESVNKISNGKTKLISEEYINNSTPLLFQCECGNIFSRPYKKFQCNRFTCPECSQQRIADTLKYDLEYIIPKIEEKGCKYISGEYKNNTSKLYLQCSCGNYFYKSWQKFNAGQNHCPECGNINVAESKRKYFPDNAKEILSQYGYTMIGDFIDGATKVKCICSRGHECNIILSALISNRHTGCQKCAREDLSGENHPNYQGGMSLLSDSIRESLTPWIKSIRDLYDHKCPITQHIKQDTVVHHLRAFSNIFDEALDELKMDINIRASIKDNDLSEADKQLLISKILEKHTNETGILIDKDIHKEFHKQYGYGGNTPEQFDDFLRKNYSITLKQIMRK